MAHAISLDVAFDEATLDEALAHLTQGLDVSHEVVTEHGPGGGWPVVRFTSSAEAELDKLLQRYGGDDQADVAFLKSSMVEV
jgi:hypothetical protein